MKVSIQAHMEKCMSLLAEHTVKLQQNAGKWTTKSSPDSLISLTLMLNTTLSLSPMDVWSLMTVGT